MLNEISKTEKDKFCKILLTCGIEKPNKQSHKYRELAVAREDGARGMSKMGAGEWGVRASSYGSNQSHNEKYKIRYIVKDVLRALCGERGIMYRLAESLCFTPETNVTCVSTGLQLKKN